MQTSLIMTEHLDNYSINEAGPIIVALAFVIAVGGMTAAAIILCGWKGAKTIGFNATKRSIEIVCR